MALPTLTFNLPATEQGAANQQFAAAVQQQTRQYLGNVATLLQRFQGVGAGSVAFRTSLVDPTSAASLGAGFMAQMLAQEWAALELSGADSAGDFDNIPG